MPQTTPSHTTLDVRGYLCPIPAPKAEEVMADLAPGQVLEITGDDLVMVIDIPGWCDTKGHELTSLDRAGGIIHCMVIKRVLGSAKP